MSIESIAIALHHSKATGSAKLVLIGIANHDGDGGSWPSVATLRKYAGVDERTVQRSIVRLEGLGEVRRIIQQGGDHSIADARRPNLYRFLLRCPHDCDRTSNHRTSRSVEVALSEELLTGVTPMSPGDTHAGGRGDASVTQTTHKNLNTQVLKPTTVAREKNASQQPSCPQGHPLVIEGGYCLYGCATEQFKHELQEVRA